MSDLPPDAARLRVLLRWLEDRITDNDTVGLYLRLQRDAVHKALDAAEEEQGRGRLPEVGSGQKPAAAVPVPAGNPRRPAKPFKLERQRTADGPIPTAVHTADCHMAGELTHAVNAVEARLALTDSGLRACEFCHPDLELGLDSD